LVQPGYDLILRELARSGPTITGPGQDMSRSGANIAKFAGRIDTLPVQASPENDHAIRAEEACIG
jgi:hypothetical protein